MIHVGTRAENVPRIKAASLIAVEGVVRNEVPQVGRAEVLLPGAEGVVQVKGVHAELIGHDDADLVGYTPRHPMVAADGLEPPDLALVVEGDAVGFVGSVPFQQRAEAQHPLAR